MNRQDEYKDLIEEIQNTPEKLNNTMTRAKRKRFYNRIQKSFLSMTIIFTTFVLLANTCAPVAYAFSQIPILKELAKAVTLSQSLESALENDYAQEINQTQTKKGVTVKLEYLIADESQVYVIYRIESDNKISSGNLEIKAETTDGQSVPTYRYEDEVKKVNNVGIYFDNEAPTKFKLKIFIYDDSDKPSEFAFNLKVDKDIILPKREIEINETVELNGQLITFESITAYPTHAELNVKGDPNNTLWLQSMFFTIETDTGQLFTSSANGHLSRGTVSEDHAIQYMESNYFYEASDFKITINEAYWTKKDNPTVWIDLWQKKAYDLPENMTLRDIFTDIYSDKLWISFDCERIGAIRFAQTYKMWNYYLLDENGEHIDNYRAEYQDSNRLIPFLRYKNEVYNVLYDLGPTNSKHYIIRISVENINDYRGTKIGIPFVVFERWAPLESTIIEFSAK